MYCPSLPEMPTMQTFMAASFGGRHSWTADASDSHRGAGRANTCESLRLTLFEPPSIMERRRDELHCLARMLDAEADRLGLIAPGRLRRFGEPLEGAELEAFVRQPQPHVPAITYDMTRGREDPSRPADHTRGRSPRARA